LSLSFRGEADGSQGGDNLFLGSENSLVGDDELEDGRILFATIDIVFDVESTNFIWRREAFDLTKINQPSVACPDRQLRFSLTRW
jgi:hypothetical protein